MRLLALVLLFICGLKSIEGCPCAEGQEKFDGSCYYISSDLKTYKDAESYCVSEGGVLAIISCEEENNFLKGKAPGQYWLGATDSEKEGEWVWNDGKPAVFTDWAPGEPNNAGSGEQCLTFTLRNPTQWNDWFCDRAAKYICEFRQ